MWDLLPSQNLYLRGFDWIPNFSEPQSGGAGAGLAGGGLRGWGKASGEASCGGVGESRCCPEQQEPNVRDVRMVTVIANHGQERSPR